ncbi:hypothetical protein H4R21_004384, partial [Coemansia helicoidea]
MKLFKYLLALTAGLSAAAAETHNVRLVGSVAGHQGDSRNDGGVKTDLDPEIRRKLQGIRGALLMRNQVQTLCEVAMVNQRYGFVAASCVDYVNGKVDPSVYYNVKLSQNVDQFLAAVVIETIIPHPKYNPHTLENNIAVVMLQTNELVKFFNPIAD